MGKRGTPTKKRHETQEKRKRALELRLKGYSYPMISDALNVSTAYAWKLVDTALSKITQEPSEAVIKQELMRLDDLYTKAYDVLEGLHLYVNSGEVVYHDGNALTDTGPVLHAIDRCLKIAKRRADLLGLDKPAKHAFTNPDGDEERPVGLQVSFVAPTPGQFLASPEDEQESS